jgi:diadenosine tetraphosphate (Ap4A) HIT family hydrolase/5-methylcytosine-specific restriction endonuclease McrA
VTFNELTEFIERKMSMSHVYQPALIRALVSAGGSATLRQLAQAFLSEDESQLIYYEKRIKEMPVKVLRKHGVITVEGQLVSLAVPPLSLEQRARIRMACEQRLQSFVQRRGLAIWDYRLLEDDPVPDSLRYLALKASGGRCQLCGATKNERPLDVDHIIPRNRGGKNELANLQVLCSKCNRSKQDKDDTDFRNVVPVERETDCIFCSDSLQECAVEENGSVIAIRDRFPVTPGHLLVLPRRHAGDVFSMTVVERAHADELIRVLRNRILDEDRQVLGFNIGYNSGEAAGQTVMHAHIHIIPRRQGDVENPRGGVRGVVPEKRLY